MPTISAVIQWNRDNADFCDNQYSRRHLWRFDGGTEVSASSSPDVVPIPMSDPNAVDPEEAFVASLSSCHMLWFLSIAAGNGYVVDSYVDQATGKMGKNTSGKIAMTVVTLRPELKWSGENIPTALQVDEMHNAAHEKCFIANSVKTDVRIQPASQ